jgi:HK97 family phage prohead protease
MYKKGNRMSIKSYTTLDVVVDSCENEVILITGFANKFLHNGDVIIDRSDEAVSPLGIDTKNFELNPILLFNHDFNQPIGKIIDIIVSEEGIKITAEVHKTSNPTVYENVKNGILKAFSIGFIAKNAKYIHDTDLYIFTETELYEISLVAVPDNPLSLIESYSTSCGCSILGKSFTITPDSKEKVMKTLKIKQVDPTNVPDVDPTNVPDVDPITPIETPQLKPKLITLEDVKTFFDINKVTPENFNEVYTLYSELGTKLDEQISLI